MTSNIRSNITSAKLTAIFKEINSTFGRAKVLILEAYNLAIQEGRTPHEAKQLLLKNITAFKKTQIYSYLPSVCKDPVKRRAGSVSHKGEVSVPKSEQNIEEEKIVEVSNPISQVTVVESYLTELQSENAMLKKEIVNISNSVIPEALSKKDKEIGDLQREKEKLEQTLKKEIDLLKSKIRNDLLMSSSLENGKSSSEPRQLKKQVTELRKELLPKVYYQNLPLIGDVTIPLQVHIYTKSDECFLEINKEETKRVLRSICKDLGQI